MRDKVAIDFFRPISTGQHQLVVMEECSRFTEMMPVVHRAAEVVGLEQNKTSSTSGIPLVVKSDNGLPFCGREFND